MFVLRGGRKQTQSGLVFLCVFYMHQGPNSELRPRVTVKTLSHYVDLEELHFVCLDLAGLTKGFVVTLINTQSHCANV